MDRPPECYPSPRLAIGRARGAFLCAALGSNDSQARSWTALTVLLGVVFVILSARERGSALAGARMVVVAVVLITAVGIFTYNGLLQSALEGLSGRVHEDTRTGEYVAFFSAVPVSDLLLGRGPKGTWYWPGFGTLNLLTMVFSGWRLSGVSPLCFVILRSCYGPQFVPSVRAHGGRSAAVFLVFLLGTCTNGAEHIYAPICVDLSSYLVSLWAGRCFCA